MKMSNSVYDVLKFLCTIFLPALGTLYFALAQIWGLPYSEQVVGTISAITTFIGVLIGISNYNYKKDNAIQPPDAILDAGEES